MKTHITGRFTWIALVVGTFLCGQAIAETVTNKDVLNLLEAGMSEDVVIQAITSGTPKFDTSSAALIKLKQKGASPAVLKAMMSSMDKPAVAATSSPTGKKASSHGLNPEEVILVLDGKENQMQYIIPGMRSAARALGLGGFATYAVLQGEKAQRRIPKTSTEFIVSVPKNAQAGNYLTLANLAVRPNGTREVTTGGGYMSYSTGIHRDRVVPVATEQLTDQSRAKDGFILYRVKPEAALSSGEYALVLYTGEVRTAGFFTQASNSFFDFGVD